MASHPEGRNGRKRFSNEDADAGALTKKKRLPELKPKVQIIKRPELEDFVSKRFLCDLQSHPVVVELKKTVKFYEEQNQNLRKKAQSLEKIVNDLRIVVNKVVADCQKDRTKVKPHILARHVGIQATPCTRPTVKDVSVATSPPPSTKTQTKNGSNKANLQKKASVSSTKLKPSNVESGNQSTSRIDKNNLGETDQTNPATNERKISSKLQNESTHRNCRKTQSPRNVVITSGIDVQSVEGSKINSLIQNGNPDDLAKRAQHSSELNTSDSDVELKESNVQSTSLKTAIVVSTDSEQKPNSKPETSSKIKSNPRGKFASPQKPTEATPSQGANILSTSAKVNPTNFLPISSSASEDSSKLNSNSKGKSASPRQSIQAALHQGANILSFAAKETTRVQSVNDSKPKTNSVSEDSSKLSTNSTSPIMPAQAAPVPGPNILTNSGEKNEHQSGDNPESSQSTPSKTANSETSNLFDDFECPSMISPGSTVLSLEDSFSAKDGKFSAWIPSLESRHFNNDKLVASEVVVTNAPTEIFNRSWMTEQNDEDIFDSLTIPSPVFSSSSDMQDCKVTTTRSSPDGNRTESSPKSRNHSSVQETLAVNSNRKLPLVKLKYPSTVNVSSFEEKLLINQSSPINAHSIAQSSPINAHSIAQSRTNIDRLIANQGPCNDHSISNARSIAQPVANISPVVSQSTDFYNPIPIVSEAISPIPFGRSNQIVNMSNASIANQLTRESGLGYDNQNFGMASNLVSSCITASRTDSNSTKSGNVLAEQNLNPTLMAPTQETRSKPPTNHETNFVETEGGLARDVVDAAAQENAIVPTTRSNLPSAICFEETSDSMIADVFDMINGDSTFLETSLNAHGQMVETTSGRLANETSGVAEEQASGTAVTEKAVEDASRRLATPSIQLEDIIMSTITCDVPIDPSSCYPTENSTSIQKPASRTSNFFGDSNSSSMVVIQNESLIRNLKRSPTSRMSDPMTSSANLLSALKSESNDDNFAAVTQDQQTARNPKMERHQLSPLGGFTASCFGNPLFDDEEVFQTNEVSYGTSSESQSNGMKNIQAVTAREEELETENGFSALYSDQATSALINVEANSLPLDQVTNATTEPKTKTTKRTLQNQEADKPAKKSTQNIAEFFNQFMQQDSVTTIDTSLIQCQTSGGAPLTSRVRNPGSVRAPRPTVRRGTNRAPKNPQSRMAIPPNVVGQNKMIRGPFVSPSEPQLTTYGHQFPGTLQREPNPFNSQMQNPSRVAASEMATNFHSQQGHHLNSTVYLNRRGMNFAQNQPFVHPHQSLYPNQHYPYYNMRHAQPNLGYQTPTPTPSMQPWPNTSAEVPMMMMMRNWNSGSGFGLGGNSYQTQGQVLRFGHHSMRSRMDGYNIPSGQQHTLDGNPQTSLSVGILSTNGFDRQTDLNVAHAVTPNDFSHDVIDLFNPQMSQPEQVQLDSHRDNQSPMTTTNSFSQVATGQQETEMKNPPPSPILSKSVFGQSVVLSWTFDESLEDFATITSYHLYAFQNRTNQESDACCWRKIGELKAKNLPMTCSLLRRVSVPVSFVGVRALDIHDRIGRLSNLQMIEPLE